jgi:hypothetical protein
MRKILTIPIAALAAAFMSIPHGRAEDVGRQSLPSVNFTPPRLIHVVDLQCRRQCDITLASCMAQVREYAAQGAVKDAATFREGYAACEADHRACYATCQ